MSFESIKRILPQAMRRAGIDSEVTAARVLEVASEALERLWGSERASLVRPVSLVRGELHIRTTSPSAAQMLRTIERTWINEVNRTIGDRRVLSIRIVQGS